MAAIVFAMPGNEALASALARQLDSEEGQMEHRHFPDGETYLRFDTPLAGRRVVLACSLHQPDDKTLPLLFAAYCVPLLACAACAFMVQRLSGAAHE